MRRFYAPPSQFISSVVHLSTDESKHLRDVLRLNVDDEVSLFDGEGREFLCRVAKTGKGKDVALLEILNETQPPSPESPLQLTLAVALLKGEKFDLVIQKATELGVSKIIPLQTKRADVKVRDETDSNKKLERWRRIALEAAKQSGRARIPEITPVTKLENLSAGENHATFFFSERGGGKIDAVDNAKAENGVFTVVGPEGGWEDAEIDFARLSGFKIVTLGGRILRAETAAIAITALVQHLCGDLK